MQFESDSAIIEARLKASYATESALPKTPFADTKEKSAAVDLKMKEMRLAQLRKELLPLETAVHVVEEVFGEMKTEGQTLMDDIVREFNLDAEDLRRRFNERMAGPFAVSTEPFEKLTDEFSRETSL